ncbi:hypothetical protein KSS87_008021 [Heliosperma pusillum]|nr:hypothetical protein KSS87_008021 [Heliosperma pusillum]
MDSPIPTTPNDAEIKRKPSEIIRNCTFALILSLFAIFSLTYAFGFFAVLLSTFSISPSNFPSQCRIVSSSYPLDFDSNRRLLVTVVELISLRADAKCLRLKVEFRDHFSGQTLLGLAEAPKEALPSDCRPNFAAAWLTKHTLKVNETYDCWYTSSQSKIEIFQDSYFGCQANDPSLSEMMRRYTILCMKIIQSWLSGQVQTKNTGFGIVIGLVSGIFTAPNVFPRGVLLNCGMGNNPIW